MSLHGVSSTCRDSSANTGGGSATETMTTSEASRAARARAMRSAGRPPVAPTATRMGRRAGPWAFSALGSFRVASEIALGTPASVIVREARRIGAALIIVGLRRHGRLERAVTDETALSVMRHASCPVLGVVPEMRALPVRVLAALDFSETSLSAARAARAVLGDHATLTLAYVPPLTQFMQDDGERVIHELGVEAGFARTARELGDEGIRVDHVVLHHQRPRPAAELILEYAGGIAIDLMAAGSARHSRIDRWMMGSVSTELVRDGSRSVLIVPPTDAPSHR